ncbi:Uncharacterized protein APZ42_015185 [Daphnia magna]|uniref:Uncharacterized protein n=1 Tax=Daphnia magna TaxID=35525 RepID=A0A162P7Z9_9CRUS|nr:Uncharacterized protein APZ42_015185 [Daphnia magna]
MKTLHILTLFSCTLTSIKRPSAKHNIAGDGTNTDDNKATQHFQQQVDNRVPKSGYYHLLQHNIFLFFFILS